MKMMSYDGDCYDRKGIENRMKEVVELVKKKVQGIDKMVTIGEVG